MGWGVSPHPQGWYASHRNYDGQCVNLASVRGSAVRFRHHPLPSPLVTNAKTTQPLA